MIKNGSLTILKSKRSQTKMKTYLPTNDILARQRFWLKHYLEPYRLGHSIAFWKENPEIYQKLDSIKNRIILASIIDEDKKYLIMTEYELTDGKFSMLRPKKKEYGHWALAIVWGIILGVSLSLALSI